MTPPRERSKLSNEYSHQPFTPHPTAVAVSKGVSRAINPRNLLVPIAELADLPIDAAAALINKAGRSDLTRKHIPGGLAAASKARTATPHAEPTMTEPSSLTEEMVATLANPGSYLNWVNAARSIPKALKHGAESFAGAMSPSHVIKSKGGNWVSGSIEDALSSLRSPEYLAPPIRGYRPDGTPFEVPGIEGPVAERGTAINNWIDKQLSKYVRNEMATPEDPIRLQADAFPQKKEAALTQLRQQHEALLNKRNALQRERNVPEHYLTSTNAQLQDIEKRIGEWDARTGLHTTRALGSQTQNTRFLRNLNKTPEPMATTPRGQAWENAADNSLDASDVSSLRDPDHRRHNPKDLAWMEKVANQDASVFYPNVGDNQQKLPVRTDFGHLIDELTNALNPESGLPPHLQLDPKNLPKIQPAQAVDLVDQINAFRAMQKVEADKLLATNPATHIFKEYPDDPRGMRWVELKSSGPDTEAHLEDALKYEGDTMRHCVGGYCPDVLSGRARILSLRDAEGRPHATVEITPGKKTTSDIEEMFRDEYDRYPRDLEELDEFAIGRNIPIDEDQILSEVSHPVINQIKGPRNLAPDPEMLPYIQDFVRSQEWGGVNDLHHTGLRRVGKKYLTEDEHKALLARRNEAGQPILDQDGVDAMESMQRIIDDADPDRI